MTTFEKMEYLKEHPYFWHLDNWSSHHDELVYYFQTEKRDKFEEGGIIMVPVDQREKLPIFFYQNREKERFFEPEGFPEWFLEIARDAAKKYQAKTRLKKFFKNLE